MRRLKKVLPAFALLLAGIISGGNVASAEQIKVDSATFPDATVRKVLLNYYKDNDYYDYDDDYDDDDDYDEDEYEYTKVPEGYIDTDDITSFSANSDYGTVSNITGLDKFPKLTYIYIGRFSGKTLKVPKTVTSVDIGEGTANTLTVSGAKLSGVWITSNAAKTVNLDACSKLTSLGVGGKKITKVTGLNKMSNLESLDIYNTKLTSIKIPSKVRWLYCYGNKKITSLNVSKCKNLEMFYARDNNLKSVNLKNNRKLTYICVSGNKKLTSINVTKNKALQSLEVAVTGVKKLDISKNTKLTSLECYQTKLTSLNLKKNKKLSWISFYGSKIKKMDLGKYKTLYISYVVKKGKTIKLKNYLGTGYKVTEKSSNLTYNKKNNTIKVKKKGDSYGYIYLKKGKKQYYINVTIR
jgi:hypothetical protein